MPVVWDETMKVGNTEIDADHRELISIINEFEQLAADPSREVSEREMQLTLERLQSYAHDHFAREEYIQAVSNYDGYDENKRHHAMLRTALSDMIQRYNSGQLGDRRTATEQMIGLLNHWLVDHIVKIDLKMRGKLSSEVWR